jgi:hypothetical protein
MHRDYGSKSYFVFGIMAMTVENRCIPPKQEEKPMIRTIRNRFRSFTARDEGVHFHQGPQGQPVPCFDEGCKNPRLTV